MDQVDELRERIAQAASTGGTAVTLAEIDALLVELDTVTKMLRYAVAQHDAHIDALWDVVVAFSESDPLGALGAVVDHLGEYGREVDENVIAVALDRARRYQEL